MKETVGPILPQSITGKYDELYLSLLVHDNIRFRARVGLEALFPKCPSNSKMTTYTRTITYKQTI
jgi:hypothetical protein